MEMWRELFEPNPLIIVMNENPSNTTIVPKGSNYKLYIINNINNIHKPKASCITFKENDCHFFGYCNSQELMVVEEESLQGLAPRGVISTLFGVPRFHTLKVRGVVHGHGVGVLIDEEETHNFIDATWVAKRGIQIEKFEGFTVAVACNNSMECNHWIPKLNISLGYYRSDHIMVPFQPSFYLFTLS